jgi:hypothetical protein
MLISKLNDVENWDDGIVLIASSLKSAVMRKKMHEIHMQQYATNIKYGWNIDQNFPGKRSWKISLGHG